MGHSRRVPSSRTEGRTEAPAEPESAARPAAVGEPTVARRVLALQRSAGNQAVTALIQRAPAATPAALTKLQQLLDDDKEEAAIAQMAHADRGRGEGGARPAAPAQARRQVVQRRGDGARHPSLKGGTLLQKLRWMIAEDVTSLALVWPLLVDKSVPAKEKTDLYPQNDMRSYFIEICNDEEMARVVDVLGGDLGQKLHWMLLEGTSWDAVSRSSTGTPRSSARRSTSSRRCAGCSSTARRRGDGGARAGARRHARPAAGVDGGRGHQRRAGVREGAAGARRPAREGHRRHPQGDQEGDQRQGLQALHRDARRAARHVGAEELQDQGAALRARRRERPVEGLGAQEGLRVADEVRDPLPPRTELRIRVRIKLRASRRPRRTRRSGATASPTAGTTSSTSRTTTASRSCSSRSSPTATRTTRSSCTSRRSCARTRATGTSGRPPTPTPPSRRTPRPATPRRTSSATSSARGRVPPDQASSSGSSAATRRRPTRTRTSATRSRG